MSSVSSMLESLVRASLPKRATYERNITLTSLNAESKPVGRRDRRPGSAPALPQRGEDDAPRSSPTHRLRLGHLELASPRAGSWSCERAELPRCS